MGGTHQSERKSVAATRPVCDYEGSQYQAEFWDSGAREYEDRVERIALQHLLPRSGSLALEIGAGSGRLTSELHNFERVVLLDYSRTQLQQAQERLGRSERYTYVAADVYQLPFVAGLFDTVTMVRVIHHMVDARSALSSIRTVLRPHGAFILEFANKRNLKSIARYLLRRQKWSPFHPDPIEFVELNFDFHPRTMGRWLKESGFIIRTQRAVSNFRLQPLKHVVPTEVLVRADALLQPAGAWLQYSPSIFVGAAADGNGSVAAAEGEFFRCPACGSSALETREGHLYCGAAQGCGKRWPIRNGIYDFKEPLN